MQNQNPVIKNYILSSEPFILSDKKEDGINKINFDNYLYHKLLKQNKDFVSLFL
jgi:hypothetical protein